MPTTLNCAECGRPFVATTNQVNKPKPRRFCDKSCSAKWRMRQPSVRERVYSPEACAKKSVHSAKNMQQGTPLWEKLTARARSERNPFHDPAVRAKSIDAHRARGYEHLNGGNGTGPTEAQRQLAEFLGWPMEHIVPTGQKGNGVPTHYKLDIADPQKLIAIEVDGQSHKGRKVRAADARKCAWLSERGWRVIHVANDEVLDRGPAAVAARLELHREVA